MNPMLFVIAAAALLLMSGLAAAWRPQQFPLIPALIGCGVAALNGLAAAFINYHAVGHDERRFWLWFGAGHGIRVGILVAVLLGAALSNIAGAPTFMLVTLIGYFCFLAAEIAALYRLASRHGSAHSTGEHTHHGGC